MHNNQQTIHLKKGPRLWEKAKILIPGGNQLLSKRAEMFLPQRWPSYYKKAKGVEIWDMDGNHFIDMCIMGVGTCILGYADTDVNRAVKKAIDNGSMSTLNSEEEVELAELLCGLHPWAQMARFTRSGGEAMSIAVRIGRAFSGKDKVAFCGYHGWHDWYLAANLANDQNLDGHLLPGLAAKGVPRALLGSSLPFHYNNIAELEEIIKKHSDIGVIVVEPIRAQEPQERFLETVREIATKINAVLIFDEITIGWRLTIGGAHLLYGVQPDIAVFGKAMSNGYPMAAIIGKKPVMQTAQETFISSTYWSERIGPTASLATIKKLKKLNVPRHLKTIGNIIKERWEARARKYNLKISISGFSPIITIAFNYKKQSNTIKTLFTKEMLKRGFLASSIIFVTFAHKKKHVDRYFDAVDEVLQIIKKGIDQNHLKILLKTKEAHTGFQRLT